ncbi:hypothetical protein AOQ84DRAFT_378576 [Glonium stellatum]|uniref:Uncharacterized protein n=1 Tax=Glonium stellatum TaxID=574774 RepID=A0A8E2JR13_9PEZI|nr:hypothetical protein AOQ84DRAFT_378576 [Glonium stellatum]
MPPAPDAGTLLDTNLLPCGCQGTELNDHLLLVPASPAAEHTAHKHAQRYGGLPAHAPAPPIALRQYTRIRIPPRQRAQSSLPASPRIPEAPENTESSSDNDKSRGSTPTTASSSPAQRAAG